MKTNQLSHVTDHKTYYAIIESGAIGEIARELLAGRITRETSHYLHCDCPGHDSVSKTSLIIDLVNNCWHCFGCNKGGGNIQLVEFSKFSTVTKGVRGEMPETHRQARDWLAAKKGLPPLSKLNMDPEQIKKYEQDRLEEDHVFGILTKLAAYYHRQLMTNPDALLALRSKYGLSEEIIKTLQIGYSDNYPANSPTVYDHMALFGHTYENDDLIVCGAFKSDYQNRPEPIFNNRFIFPYWNRGRVVYLIGRETQWTPEHERKFSNTGSKYKKLPTHSEKKHKKVSKLISNSVIWNEDILASRPDHIILAEGMTDAISAMDHGFNVISPITTNIKKDDKPRIARKLKSHSPEQPTTVYITFDTEISQAGKTGAINTSKWLESENIPVRIISLPYSHEQQAAADTIAERWKITPSLTMKEVTKASNLIPTQDKEEYRRLKSIAKQDLNSYFLTHSTRDFQSLINSAPSRLEMILNDFQDQIQAKDPSILTNTTFLVALSQAHKTDATLHKRITTLLEKNKFSKKEINDAIINMQKAKPDACEFTENKKREATPLSNALSTLNIPVPESCESLSLPPGYEITINGIHLKKESHSKTERKHVCSVPLFITQRMQDVFTNNMLLQIAYYQPENYSWRTLEIPRKIAFDKMRIIALADKGFPVGKNTKELAEYLYDLETVNRLHYETTDTSSQMGWIIKKNAAHGKSNKANLHADNQDISTPSPSFIYGDICHGDTTVSFIGADDGDKQAGRSFSTQSGSLAAWLEIAEHILTYYPRVAVPFYGSFVAPLLHILNLNSFFIDISAGTSSGKSIALRFVASAWGNPNEKNPNSIVHSWRASHVGLERIATTQTDLPLFLDDTKTAGNQKQLKNFIYGLAEGHGKVRGSIAGTQVTRYWRTVTLSTGEAPLSDYATDGGAKVRVLSIEGYPFEKTDQESRELVTELNNIVCLNYGHIGPLFIDHLIANHDRWPEYRAMFTDTANKILTTSGAAARLADLHAAIVVAAHILHETKPPAGAILPFPFTNPFIDIWPEIEDDAAEADIGKRSLQYVWEWVNANENKFVGRHFKISTDSMGNQRQIDETPTPNYGNWEPSDNWERIYVYPHVLREALEHSHYDSNAAIKAWKQHGWLHTDKDRKRNTCTHQGTKKVAITRYGIDAAHDGELFGIAAPQGLEGEDIQGGEPPTVTTHYTATNRELHLIENKEKTLCTKENIVSPLRRLDRKYNNVTPQDD